MRRRSDDAVMNENEHVEKLRELEHTADVGESSKTPWIVLGDVWVVTSIVVAAIILLSVIAYWLAT
jgi:hypothetical protein